MFDVLDRQTRLTGNQKKIITAAVIGDALEFFDYFLIGFVLAFLITAAVIFFVIVKPFNMLMARVQKPVPPAPAAATAAPRWHSAVRPAASTRRRRPAPPARPARIPANGPAEKPRSQQNPRPALPA